MQKSCGAKSPPNIWDRESWAWREMVDQWGYCVCVIGGPTHKWLLTSMSAYFCVLAYNKREEMYIKKYVGCKECVVSKLTKENGERKG